jgi:putative phosphoesterase
MKIAIISDIHSNFVALESVLNDIRKENISQIYCLGDIVGIYPQFKEVVKCFINNNIISIIGNYDKACISEDAEKGVFYLRQGISEENKKIFYWSHKNLDDYSKNYLKSLPLKIKLEFEKHKILLVHGSPNSISKYIYPDTPTLYLENLLKENMCNVIVCGHTHIPMIIKTKEGYFLNPGSVGMPKDGSPEATYLIADVNSEEPDFKIKKVPFDYNYIEYLFKEKVLSFI